MFTPDPNRATTGLCGGTGTTYKTNRLSKEEMAQILAAARAGNVDGQTFFAQSDEDILAQIREQTVPKKVLLDNVGWKLICTIRSLHVDQVSGEQWSGICELRDMLTHFEISSRG